MSINAGSAALTVEPVSRCAEHSVLLLPQRACALQDERFSPVVLGVVLAAHVAAWLGLMAGEVRQPPQPPQPPPILISVIRPSAEPARPVAVPQLHRPQPARQAAPSRPQPVPTPPDPTLAVPASMPQPAPAMAAAEVPQPPAGALPVAEPAPPVAAAPVATAAVADAAVEPLEQPRFDADYLDNPTPAYPRLSRRLGEEGRVLLRVRVSAAGAPGQVELHRSSGHVRLDEVAAETVRHWKFAPARQSGKPVAAWVIVPIQFSLKG